DLRAGRGRARFLQTRQQLFRAIPLTQLAVHGAAPGKLRPEDQIPTRRSFRRIGGGVLQGVLELAGVRDTGDVDTKLLEPHDIERPEDKG
ncbi:hypothetical protein, partial [Tritonibacter sp. SIMBA_163]|uniref:hypothetical protein n=1 Tax=Tritonibacter sp. SIMBA_163 TaxID=3080868 RepID=UPI0039803A38